MIPKQILLRSDLLCVMGQHSRPLTVNSGFLLTPVAAHDTSHVTLVDLSRRLHLSKIEGVEIVIFGSEQEDSR